MIAHGDGLGHNLQSISGFDQYRFPTRDTHDNRKVRCTVQVVVRKVVKLSTEDVSSTRSKAVLANLEVGSLGFFVAISPQVLAGLFPDYCKTSLLEKYHGLLDS